MDLRRSRPGQAHLPADRSGGAVAGPVGRVAPGSPGSHRKVPRTLRASGREVTAWVTGMDMSTPKVRGGAAAAMGLAGAADPTSGTASPDIRTVRSGCEL